MKRTFGQIDSGLDRIENGLDKFQEGVDKVEGFAAEIESWADGSKIKGIILEEVKKKLKEMYANNEVFQELTDVLDGTTIDKFIEKVKEEYGVDLYTARHMAIWTVTTGFGLYKAGLYHFNKPIALTVERLKQRALAKIYKNVIENIDSYANKLGQRFLGRNIDLDQVIRDAIRNDVRSGWIQGFAREKLLEGLGSDYIVENWRSILRSHVNIVEDVNTLVRDIKANVFPTELDKIARRGYNYLRNKNAPRAAEFFRKLYNNRRFSALYARRDWTTTEAMKILDQVEGKIQESGMEWGDIKYGYSGEAKSMQTIADEFVEKLVRGVKPGEYKAIDTLLVAEEWIQAGVVSAKQMKDTSLDLLEHMTSPQIRQVIQKKIVEDGYEAAVNFAKAVHRGEGFLATATEYAGRGIKAGFDVGKELVQNAPTIITHQAGKIGRAVMNSAPVKNVQRLWNFVGEQIGLVENSPQQETKIENVEQDIKLPDEQIDFPVQRETPSSILNSERQPTRPSEINTPRQRLPQEFKELQGDFDRAIQRGTALFDDVKGAARQGISGALTNLEQKGGAMLNDALLSVRGEISSAIRAHGAVRQGISGALTNLEQKGGAMLNDSLLSVRGEMSSAIRAARSAGVNTVVQLEAKAAGAMKYTGKALGTLFIGLQLIDTFNTFIEMGKITELQNKIAFLLGGSDPMIGYLDQKKDEMLGNTALSWLLFGITFALNPVAGLAVMGGAAAVQGVVGIATADSRQREENKNNTDMMMRLQNLYGADPDAVWNSANSHGVSDDINRNLDSVDYKKNLLIMEKYRAFLPQLKAQVEKFKAAPRSVHSLGWTSTDVMLQAQMQHFASFIEDIPDPSTYESNMRDLGRRTIYLHDNMLTLKKLGARAFWTPQRIRQYLRPEMYQMADELGWLDNTPIEIMSSIEALAIRYQNRQIAHDNASKHNNSEMQPLIVDRSPNRPRVKEWDHLMHYLDLQQEVEGMLEKDLHQPEKYYV